MTKSINFEMLREKWPTLADLGGNAEVYAYSDPQSAIVKLRCFTELLVGEIYRDLGLNCEDDCDLYRRLNGSDFSRIVDRKIIKKLHAIRLKGNKAAHLDDVSIGDAIWLIKEAYFIASWLHTTYGDDDENTCDNFIPPVEETKKLDELRSVSHDLQDALESKNSDLEAALLELQGALAKEQDLQVQFNALQHEVDIAKVEAFKISSEKANALIEVDDGEIDRRITIEEIFSDYQLTSGQADLVQALDGFLTNKNDSVFLLRGYAGTGKTFITKGLTEYLSSIGRSYILAAPTGKASKVIASKTKSPAYTIHKTIYSFKDIKEYRVDDEDGTQTYKFYSELSVNEDPANTVYIFDEASMIADIYQEAEFFRFGTGYLLKDLLKYINLDNNDHNKKIIFIGDDAQLPPVGMGLSPALSEKHLRESYGIETLSCELTEVVRQDADSGVLENAFELRKSIDAKEFYKLDFDLNHADIEHVDHVNLMKTYLDSCGDSINGRSIIIAHSNASVTQYNRLIREHFFPGQATICPGDKVMAVNNNNQYGLFISNGDFGLARQVSDQPEVRKIPLKWKSDVTGKVEKTEVTLQFRGIEVGFKDLEGNVHFFWCQIVENLLYSEQANLDSDENKALYIDFSIRNPALRPNTKEFSDALKSDPYFNALKLKFGYAITCHKAQGSEWENVFVNCKTHQNVLTQDYFRWLYTAITRASQKLYTLDEPHIKPGGRMKVIDDIGFETHVPNTPVPIIQESFVDSEEGEFDIPLGNKLLMSLLNMVRNRLTGSDIDLVGITHSAHQESYFFQRGQDNAKINIYYNNAKEVSNLQPHEANDLSQQVLVLIAPLKGIVLNDSPSTDGEKFEFDEPFLEEFHSQLFSLLEPAGIKITGLEQRDWVQRYMFSKGQDVTSFEFHYNGKNQFARYSPFKKRCNSPALRQEIKNIIVDELLS